ncbi:hypothetical protein QTO34_012519 [Cnephaeus nilssonii]|uniref:Mediator of RNA polymerase II transcription subunit 8 n=1 Tax=Cnephaeus nilssonii TaxID=3371016 RepID=A0AA40LCE8_CNENI|nr:hypothetical protein QTO34_012519 [Eptesicus nilssonii]
MLSAAEPKATAWGQAPTLKKAEGGGHSQGLGPWCLQKTGAGSQGSTPQRLRTIKSRRLLKGLVHQRTGTQLHHEKRKRREEKQLKASLDALLSQVADLNNSLGSFIYKLENKYDRLTWPSVLDSFALLSGQLNTLNKVLKHEKTPQFRNQVIIPLLLSPDRDEDLMRQTEGRVPAFSHEVVPDHLRTTPDPEVEEQEKQLTTDAARIGADVAQKQIQSLNEMCSNLLEKISKEERESESGARVAVLDGNYIPLMVVTLPESAAQPARPLISMSHHQWVDPPGAVHVGSPEHLGESAKLSSPIPPAFGKPKTLTRMRGLRQLEPGGVAVLVFKSPLFSFLMAPKCKRAALPTQRCPEEPCACCCSCCCRLWTHTPHRKLMHWFSSGTQDPGLRSGRSGEAKPQG